LWEEWLPMFERAVTWNGWTESDKLIQLVGHLRGKALQEWGLLSDSQKSTFATATAQMRNRLDPASKLMATQEFHHVIQEDTEQVNDFICRLEQPFRRAYGRDHFVAEMRDALLLGQLQAGLREAITTTPAVSGAGTYQELCAAVKNEERRQLARRGQLLGTKNISTVEVPLSMVKEIIGRSLSRGLKTVNCVTFVTNLSM